MKLVDYSDSDDPDGRDDMKDTARANTAEIDGMHKKRKREEQSPSLPPLPDTFHDLYVSTARVSKHDDPNLHGGRQRQTPHVEGQWPTHVYIECTDQRTPFTEALKSVLDASGVKPFMLKLNGLRWVANSERNRWFLVVQAQRSSGDELNRLLRASNMVAGDFGQPLLYVSQMASKELPPIPKNSASGRRGGRAKANALHGSVDIHALKACHSDSYEDVSGSFHVSIGWTLEEPPTSSLNFDNEGNTVDDSLKNEFLVQVVKAKVGNATMVVELGSKAPMSNGIVGL
ncbi:MAG: hypothetical protein Q9222_003240 [Ikaeria aurantiellina]